MSTKVIATDGAFAYLQQHITAQPALLISGARNRVTVNFGILESETDGPVIQITGAGNALILHYAVITASGSVAIQGSDFADEIVNNQASVTGDILLGGGDDWFQNNYARPVGQVFGGTGNDALTTYQGTIAVRYFGEDGLDFLIGGSASDLLDGGNDADTLRGQGGDDQLIGGTGADRLDGGTGDDQLDGGGDQGDIALFWGDWADFSYSIAGGAGSITDLDSSDGDEGSDTISGISILRFTDQQVDTRIARNELVLTDPGESYTNTTDRYGYFAVDLQGEGATFVNEAEIRGTAVPHAEMGRQAATGALALSVYNASVENRAGASIIGFDTAIGTVKLPDFRSGDGLRLINDGLIKSLEASAIAVGSSINLVNGSTGIIDAMHGNYVGVAVGAVNANATIVNAGLIQGSYASIRTNHLTLDNEGSIVGAIHAGLYSRIDNGGSIEGGYDVYGGLTLLNRGTSEGDFAIDVTPVGWHYNLGFTIAEIDNRGTFTGDIRIGGEAQFHDAPPAHADFRTIIVNSGTITGSIVSDPTLATLPGNLVPDASFVEEIVNSGVIDGDIRLGDGNDRLTNSGTITGIVDGGKGNDLLDGGGATIALLGGDGDDRLVTCSVDPNGVAASLDGGAGFDTVLFDRASSASIYVIDLGLASQTLADGSTLTGIEAIEFTGGSGSDRVRGGSASDALNGGGGSDILTGGGGADILDGGAGADTFLYLATADSTGPAQDTIRGFETGMDKIDLRAPAAASVSWTVSGGVTLVTIDAVGGAMTTRVEGSLALSDFLLTPGVILGTGASEHLIGGAIANIMDGRAGNDLIDGGAGADTLHGGAGHDTYIVDNAGDAIVEAANAGNDHVHSSVTHTLAANVEYLTLTGAGAINGTGNTLNNILNGNDAANVLSGGLGVDFMTGGLGDDTYIVDSASDQVTEAAGGGTDTVQSSVSWTLGANVERLTLTGTAALMGVGNDLDNVITGNAAANFINGGLGADAMQGGLGNDTFIVDNVGDTVADTGGVDTVQSSVSFTMGSTIDNLILTGTATVDGTGNALWNVMTGNAANNVLDGGLGNDVLNGGAGADILIGGAGHDTYFVDQAGDQVIDTGGGNDHVHAAFDYVLGSDLEYLTLTGSAVSGTGNAKNNLIYGNASNNVIDGGLGADFMVGGMGDDTYFVENGSDSITEHLNQGNDTVMSSVHHALRGNIENLTLIGTNAVSATGNELANVLTGNSANNAIMGGLGADILSGGGGNDSFIYRGTAESNLGSLDMITGFNAGDKINLSAIDAILGTPANNDAFTFIGADAFHGVAGELRATETGGVWTIEADVDGNGIADLVIGLTAEPGHIIGAADFVL